MRDATAAGQPQPNYQAFLVEGNDVGGIDVGLLVKSTINVISVEQVGKDTTFLQPDGTTALLNDRPPLVMMATASQPEFRHFAAIHHGSEPPAFAAEYR